jgi:Arc/MetJ-type ribon-helix-helix transcriptional regulator
MTSRIHTDMIPLRITPEVGEYLNRLTISGGYKSRTELVRSMIDDIKKDDEAAHGETKTNL